MNPNIAYVALEGQLFIYDLGTSAILWRGRPDSREVHFVLWIPGEEDGQVLVERSPARGYWTGDVLRCNPRGEVMWVAELPDPGPDFHPSISWANAGLLATSWSCFLVRLDPGTGRIIRSSFTAPGGNQVIIENLLHAWSIR